MMGFAYGIMAGVGAVFGSLAVAYTALAVLWPASMPAPAITPLVPIDEKLRFLREHPNLDPQVLAVGSSITWRQLAGAAFIGPEKKPHHFLNGGTAHLRIHQSRELIRFYLDHYTNVRTVLVMTGLPDFADCTDEPARLFNPRDAAAYAFGNWPPEPYFYFRYFSPQRYVRTALTLMDERRPFVGGLHHDAYGSSPLEVPEFMKRGLRYGAIRPDPACIESLVALSHELTARGLDFVLVFPPVHPEYRTTFPTAVTDTAQIAERVAAATARDRTSVVVLHDHPGFVGDDFYDAYHLQWPAVKRLSGLVSQAVALSVTKGKISGKMIAEPASAPH